MSIESNLPENLDKRAVNWGLYLGNVNNALWHIQSARDCYIVQQPRMSAPNKAIVYSLKMLELAFKAIVTETSLIADSANRIADEAHGE